MWTETQRDAAGQSVFVTDELMKLLEREQPSTMIHSLSSFRGGGGGGGGGPATSTRVEEEEEEEEVFPFPDR